MSNPACPGRLRRALRHEYRLEWNQAFCDLVFAARTYTTRRRNGQPCVAEYEKLERAVAVLYAVEVEWRPLVGRVPPPLFPTVDNEERRLWRLHKHAMSYFYWLYRKHGVPYERWRAVGMLRSEVFIKAVLELSWDTGDVK